MSSESIRSERGRRLSSLLTEVLVLFLLVSSAFKFFGDALGNSSRIAAAMFAFAWLRGAVRELSQARRNPGDTRRAAGPGHIQTMTMIVIGTMPWLIVNALHNDGGLWPAWHTTTIPDWARGAGALIALVGALRSSSTAAARPASNHPFGNVGRDGYILVAFLLMMSSSALVALLAAGQLAALLVGQRRPYEETFDGEIIGPLDSFAAASPLRAAGIS